MRADVCSCLFTIPLIAVRLPDILLPYLHCCEVCRVVPVEKGLSMGSSSRVPLHPHVQKSQACAFEELGSAEINLCDPPALGEMCRSGAEVLQRAAQAGTGTAPSLLSLGPTADQTPWVKEC